MWVAETPAFLVRVSARGGGSSREEHLNAAAGLGGAAAQRRPIGYLSAARFKLETSWAIYAVTLSCQRLEEEENMSLRSAPS